MQIAHHEKWVKTRIQKILDIFGEDWFVGKKILELAACHGDVGIELSKLGSIVTFSDARPINIQSIQSRLNSVIGIKYYTRIINQEEKYHFSQPFDLTIHMGVLYHLENWKQDLECAIKSSKIMILESLVNPYNEGGEEILQLQVAEPIKKYHGLNNKLILFSQQSVEDILRKNNCSFIRFDNEQLDSLGWDSSLLKHLYSWKEFASKDKVVYNYFLNGEEVNIHYRRFWLVINNDLT
jgi:2-polyprenyl-3-methyl-5-hydroxy-6-metoxy-1,4-benzoquinol methylase